VTLVVPRPQRWLILAHLRALNNAIVLTSSRRNKPHSNHQHSALAAQGGCHKPCHSPGQTLSRASTRKGDAHSVPPRATHEEQGCSDRCCMHTAVLGSCDAGMPSAQRVRHGMHASTHAHKRHVRGGGLHAPHTHKHTQTHTNTHTHHRLQRARIFLPSLLTAPATCHSQCTWHEDGCASGLVRC
jgi:hypothetical protein